MAVFLNAYQVDFLEGSKINVFSFPYDKELLLSLRQKYAENFSFFRFDDKIECTSKNNNFTILKNMVENWNIDEVDLVDKPDLCRALIKDSLIRLIEDQKKNRPLKYAPIELLSSRSQDDIIGDIANEKLPFSVLPLFTVDVREIREKIQIIIDCCTKIIVVEPCSYFIEKGYNIEGKTIFSDDRGRREKLGIVKAVLENSQITYTNSEGQEITIDSRKVFIAASKENITAYCKQIFKHKSDAIMYEIKKRISIFNKGENKLAKIKQFKSFLGTELKLLNSLKLKTADLMQITNEIQILENPSFILFGGQEWKQADSGILKFGPYSKREFDSNNPSICVICAQSCKGRVEQFIFKFLYGIPSHEKYSKGFQDRFCLGNVNVEYFTTSSDDVASYQKAITEAMQKKADENGRWSLALVQIKKDFKSKNVTDNPYYSAKTTFLTKQIPVQSFTLDTLNQADRNLGYSLNNMALATYAKMGGTPWLLKSSMIMTHELVIGIGSAYISEEGKNTRNNRIMGITTVFSGTGNFMLSGTSEAVSADEYQSELIKVLRNTINKLKITMAWSKDDAVRIVFHSAIKPFNHIETEAVKKVLSEFSDYGIEYAFLKISYDHPMQLFDDKSLSSKGRLRVTRGQSFQISNNSILISFVGKNQLKQEIDGHPKVALVSIHPNSTFKDIRYLTNQLFNFTAHSWRGYFPNPLPVTIIYSNLIANNLGWFNLLPHWSNVNIIGKIGNTKWFL